jgi:hypothetical protein
MTAFSSTFSGEKSNFLWGKVQSSDSSSEVSVNIQKWVGMVHTTIGLMLNRIITFPCLLNSRPPQHTTIAFQRKRHREDVRMIHLGSYASVEPSQSPTVLWLTSKPALLKVVRLGGQLSPLGNVSRVFLS